MPASRARCRPGRLGPIGNHDRDGGVETPVGNRVDHRLEVGSASGDQDSEPTARRRSHLSRAGDDEPDPDRMGLAVASQGVDDSLGLSGAQTRTRPIPMLNARNISSRGIRPRSCSSRNSGGTVHARRSISAPHPSGRHARKVLGDAAAGDVRHALDESWLRAAAAPAADTSGAARAARRPPCRRVPGRRCRPSSRLVSNNTRRASE